jgi:streptogramin lyase
MFHANRKILGAGLILLISLGMLIFRSNASAATNQSINEFPTSGHPGHIITGPDGNLWFTESNGIGRITTAGVVTEYPVVTGSCDPGGIAAGPDGNIWFTLPCQGKVGRITPSGSMTETGGFNTPWGITLGPDGNMWITENEHVSQITTTGTITTFLIGIERFPEAMTLGPDGNLWYVSTVFHRGGTEIGQITPTGVYTTFWASGISDLTAGRDGNIWFSQLWQDKIGRITPAGIITEFNLPPTPGGYCGCPNGITTGPDGYIWFMSSFNTIGRITPSGQVSYFSGAGDEGIGITTGPDGNIWFTDHWSQQIGRLIIYRSFLPLVAR